MKIQYLDYFGKNIHKYNVEKVNYFSNPNHFNSYDINIIDLRNDEIWKNTKKTDSKSTIDTENDFYTIKDMSEDAHNSIDLYILPSNISFQMRTYQSTLKSIKLKDMTDSVKVILNKLLDFPYELVFGPSTTKINGLEIYADFYFRNEIPNKVETLKSNESEQIIGYKSDSDIVTTLDFKSNDELFSFLKYFGFEEAQKVAPDWFENENYFDDIEKKESIQSSLNIIEEETININESEEKLEINNKYKSILYQNGDDLVDVVTSMLNRIFDLEADFDDVKNEDYSFEHDGDYYIFEIKGINTNVKYQNISQLDNHYSTFLDSLEEGQTYKNIYKVLIINHQRKMEPQLRHPVNEEQINLAKKKYGILIIETVKLLELFDLYLSGELTRESAIKQFKKIGLLDILD